jgi:hypothetical protein
LAMFCSEILSFEDSPAMLDYPVLALCSPSAPVRPIEGLPEGRISGSS